MMPSLPFEYHFCTYFDIKYLTRGLALYHSLVRHCRQPFVLWVLCFDDITYTTLARLKLPAMRLIPLEEFEIGDDALPKVKSERSLVEYYWTCTPSLPLYILRHFCEVEIITYIDADMYFFDDPMPIYIELGEKSVLIIEHRYAARHAHMASTSGIFNVSVLAFRRDVHALSCLNWWRERCLNWCFARVEEDKFGDQKYLDKWPRLFEGVVVLQHKGAGLAPWNMSQYKTEWKGGLAFVDGQPLIFFHFHGFKIINFMVVEPAPYFYRISPRQIKHLYFEYLRSLSEAKHEVFDDREANTGIKKIPFLELIKSVFNQKWLLIFPQWLAITLWKIGGWRRIQNERVGVGLEAYERGDLPTARRHFMAAVWRDPTILHNSRIRQSLLKTLIGSAHGNL